MKARNENAVSASVSAVPTVVIDTREQKPLEFSRLTAIRGTLHTGDYSVQGLEGVVAVERKSVPDMVNSLTKERARFMAEIERMRGYWFRRLAVIGSPTELQTVLNRRRVTLNTIAGNLAKLDALVPLVFFSTPEAAARGVEAWFSCVWAICCSQVGAKVYQPEWAREDVMSRWKAACHQSCAMRAGKEG